MKKILFVSTRNPYSGRYSGDVIRSFKIINVLKKKYEVDVAYLGKKNDDAIKGIKLISFYQPNFLLKLFGKVSLQLLIYQILLLKFL